MYKIYLALSFIALLSACGKASYSSPNNNNIAQGIDNSSPEGESPQAPQKIYYQEDISPIISSKCLSCHNKQTLSGGIRLDSYSLLFRQRTHKDINPPHKKLVDLVLIGSKELSGLFLSIADEIENHHEKIEEGTMPPKLKLTDNEINIIGQWIDGGALLKPIKKF